MDIRDILIQRIKEKAFIDCAKNELVTLNPDGTEPDWFFDFRTLLLDQEFLRSASELFWDHIGKEKNIQIGGLESASIPLVTAFVLSGNGASGFYIRKSRKKKMQMKQIEGDLNDNEVVLVDDLVNTGSSFKKQIEILIKEGKKVTTVFTILRFRDKKYYKYFDENNIEVISIFDLKDFGMQLLTDRAPMHEPYTQKWYFGSRRSHFFSVEPKAQPILDDKYIYMAADNGYIWCLNKNNGDVVWKRKLLLRIQPSKNTFSFLAVFGQYIYIGAHNGVFFILNKVSGKKHKVLNIGESITTAAVCEKKNLAFFGIEEVTRPQDNYLVAHNLLTGEKLWEYKAEARINAQPIYTEEVGLLITADETGVISAIDAVSGKKRWECKTGGPIMSRGTFFDKKKLVSFASYDGSLYILKVRSGKVFKKIGVGEWLYASPVFGGRKVFMTSLDKFIYCFDVEKKEKIWEFETRGRIFSSPVLAYGSVFFGNNEGILYELDADTGKEKTRFQVTERITNSVIFSEKSIYLNTFANEVYCLEKANNV